jgi:hypothetical protein
VDLEKYTIEADEDFLSYSFYRYGPKGKIKKVINFTPIPSLGVECYNLGFGDWNALHETIDDNIITNNDDTEKVLATVSAIALDFQYSLSRSIYIHKSKPGFQNATIPNENK